MTTDTTKNIIVRMRPVVSSEAPGWQVRLKAINPDYRVLSRSERFGRLAHVIKIGGHRIELLQGNDTACKSLVNCTAPQARQILEDLLKAGALSTLPDCA